MFAVLFFYLAWIRKYFLQGSIIVLLFWSKHHNCDVKISVFIIKLVILSCVPSDQSKKAWLTPRHTEPTRAFRSHNVGCHKSIMSPGSQFCFRFLKCRRKTASVLLCNSRSNFKWIRPQILHLWADSSYRWAIGGKTLCGHHWLRGGQFFFFTCLFINLLK